MSSRQPQSGRQPPTVRAGNSYNYNPAQQAPPSQNRLLDALAERNLPPEEPESRAPTLATAMFLGVFEFPFYFSSLGCLVGTACGLAFTFLVMVFSLDQGFTVGAAVRPLGQCAMMSLFLTMGFAMAHCRVILEETAYGADAVQNWPGFDWKGWMLTFLFAGLILGEALAAGYLLAIPRLFGGNWLPALGIAFLLYPIFLLSCLENDSPMVPIAMPVLRSFKTVWWCWGLLYFYSAIMLVGWVVVAFIGLRVQPYLSVLVTGPLMAIMLMIYARLLGRLTWCAGQETEDED